MKKIAVVLTTLAAFLIGAPAFAQAPTFFPGTQTVQEANYVQTPVVITATAQTSAAIPVPPVVEMCIVGVGNTLTTGTFAVQGSQDGVNWVPINIIVTSGAGAVPVGVLTVTQTAALASYQVNVDGWPLVRTVSSGTFTGTSLTLQVIFTSRKGVA